ncbi:MAG: hypothetical protein EXR79_06220 [Myxococcales bacterium]|nr:hypothetical protein [Myxococcales bacterium]
MHERCRRRRWTGSRRVRRRAGHRCDGGPCRRAGRCSGRRGRVGRGFDRRWGARWRRPDLPS